MFSATVSGAGSSIGRDAHDNAAGIRVRVFVQGLDQKQVPQPRSLGELTLFCDPFARRFKASSSGLYRKRSSLYGGRSGRRHISMEHAAFG